MLTYGRTGVAVILTQRDHLSWVCLHEDWVGKLGHDGHLSEFRPHLRVGILIRLCEVPNALEDQPRAANDLSKRA